MMAMNLVTRRVPTRHLLSTLSTHHHLPSSSHTHYNTISMHHHRQYATAAAAAAAEETSTTTVEQPRNFIMDDESLREKTDKELRQQFVEEMRPLITEITLADEEKSYEPSDMWYFALGTHELKFKVVTAVMQKFGREIPNADLCHVNHVRDLVNWFVKRVRAETPRPTMQVPSNVRLFIDKNYKRRDLEAEGVLKPRE